MFGPDPTQLTFLFDHQSYHLQQQLLLHCALVYISLIFNTRQLFLKDSQYRKKTFATAQCDSGFGVQIIFLVVHRRSCPAALQLVLQLFPNTFLIAQQRVRRQTSIIENPLLSEYFLFYAFIIIPHTILYGPTQILRKQQLFCRTRSL